MNRAAGDESIACSPRVNKSVTHDLLMRQKCREGDTLYRKALINAGHISLPPRAVTDIKLNLSRTLPYPVWSPLADVRHFQPRLMADVAEFIAKREGMTVAELRGDGRTRHFCEPRHEAFYICWKRLGKSFAEIGRYFNRDHSSVIGGVKRHMKRNGIDDD